MKNNILTEPMIIKTEKGYAIAYSKVNNLYFDIQDNVLNVGDSDSDELEELTEVSTLAYALRGLV